MSDNKNKNKEMDKSVVKIVEFAVVIFVIAVLLIILVPKFGKFSDKSKERAALTEAQGAWTELSVEHENAFEYLTTFDGEIYGWTFDSEAGVARYSFDDKYVVVYDGKDFKVVENPVVHSAE